MPAVRIRVMDSLISAPPSSFTPWAARFFHDADGRAQRLRRIALVRAKRQINHHKGPLHGPHHARGVVNHLVQRDGQGGFVAGHDVGGRVADSSTSIPAPSRWWPSKVVGREHGNFFAARFMASSWWVVTSLTSLCWDIGNGESRGMKLGCHRPSCSTDPKFAPMPYRFWKVRLRLSFRSCSRHDLAAMVT